MFSPMLLSRPQAPTNAAPAKQWETVPRPANKAAPIAVRPLPVRAEERVAALA